MIYRLNIAFVSLLALVVGCSSSGDGEPKAAPSTGKPSTAVTWPALTSAVAKDEAVEARIDALIGRMTLEEKVGQMLQPEIRQVTPEDFTNFHLGSVLNGGGSTPNNNKYATADDWVKMADGFWHASVDKRDGRVGIPMMWGSDAVHGVGNVIGATLFPHNIALGAARNPDLIRQIGAVTAREIAATGLDWNFSPTVAVSRDERWGRAYEAYSEDPEVVRAYAGEMVKGLQGIGGSEQFLADEHVIATAKHWIGDGGTAKGVDRGDTLADERTLRDIHGAGYFSAIEAGVQVVMASFTTWQGQRMHGHEYLLTDVLKEQMGFDGFIIGDWSGHGFIPGCTPLDCPATINAGLDMYMVPEPEWKTLFHNTVQQVRDGVIPMSRIDDAVRRILRVKIRAGLFEKGAPSTRALAGDESVLGAPAHRAVARQAVRESLVMLKNKNNVLPLSPNSHVLVAGDGAHNIGKQTGGWSISWQGTGSANEDFPGATSIWQGIEQAVSKAGGTAVLSEDGSFTEKPDAAIVVFGESPYAEMQGDIVNTFYKPKDSGDAELLKKLRNQGVPVVALFITGRPLHINRELNASDAFVVIWQPGTEGGGVADVIFRDAQGKVVHDMRGRLSFTWPKNPDQVPLNRGDDHYDPLFAYGFGLSYNDTDTLGDALPESVPEQAQSQDVLEIFVRRPIMPWNIEIVGNQNDRSVVTSNTQEVSTVRIEALDRNEQQDIRRVVWSGDGPGHVALFSEERQDLSTYLDEEAALVFDIQVAQPPTSTAFLRLGCGSFCASDIDFTQRLQSLADKDWQTISVDLRCFPRSGATFGVKQPIDEFIEHTLQPFVLWTASAMDVSFGDVRIIKGRAAEATLSCP